ncbi:MAG: hypothetical protein JSR99_04840 [Proteobacteria bacterium]|nr:hypothetical protein [Pseudomonadota bacterium]
MSPKASRAAVLGLFILPALAVAGAAETSAPEGGRFMMSPVEGGLLRLDTQTGAVAMCAKSGSDWTCKPVDDETASAPSDKVSHLESENRDLKDRIRELEELLETRPVGPPPHDVPPLAEGPPGGVSQLPTEEEVDQALDYMSRVYKKIRDHIKDLDKPQSKDDHAVPPPPADAPPPPKGAL